MNRIVRNDALCPNASSTGRRAVVKSTGTGMSKPLSAPKVDATPLWWLRSTPGWICMTRPSSQDIAAIWNSMCAANASASSAVTVAARAAA